MDGYTIVILQRGDVWIAGCEFGREAEDSGMAAGAAYGRGATPREAIEQVLATLGLS